MTKQSNQHQFMAYSCVISDLYLDFVFQVYQQRERDQADWLKKKGIFLDNS